MKTEQINSGHPNDAIIDDLIGSGIFDIKIQLDFSGVAFCSYCQECNTENSRVLSAKKLRKLAKELTDIADRLEVRNEN